MWSALQNCSSLSNSNLRLWGSRFPTRGSCSVTVLCFSSSVYCVCVLQVCTLHTSRIWTKMKKSSNSFRRWDLHVLHMTLLLLLNDLQPRTSVLLIFVCLFVFQGVQQKRPSPAQNAILRRYFLELTQSFIIPLVANNDFVLIIILFFFSRWSHNDIVLLVCASVTF